MTVSSLELHPSVRRLRAVGHVLDNALRIPGTRFRIGADGLIGVVPVVGDVAGAILASYILLEAARLGVPHTVLARMFGNVAVDTIVGKVPLLGDLFDIGWKANLRNLALIEAYVAQPGPTRAASRRRVALVTAGIVLLVIGGIAAAVALGNLVAEHWRW